MNVYHIFGSLCIAVTVVPDVLVHQSRPVVLRLDL